MAVFSINRAVLVGRLTRDPEMRALPTGTSVCSMRIACNSRRREGETWVDRPNYFDVSAYGGAAEAIADFMRKGSRVGVDGRLEWREWETTDGQRRQAVSIVADTVQFLDGPSSGADDADVDLNGDVEEVDATAAPF
jgi:single-strand DNA-binding protein